MKLRKLPGFRERRRFILGDNGLLVFFLKMSSGPDIIISVLFFFRFISFVQDAKLVAIEQR